MVDRRKSARGAGHAAEQGLEAQVREALDAGVQALDRPVLERLAAARREAVSEARTLTSRRAEPRWWDLPWLMPAGALASIGLTVAVIARLSGAPAPAPLDAYQGSDRDLELLAEVEDLELIENLDFYLWLGASAGAG